jgi:hypothetical protein
VLRLGFPAASRRRDENPLEQLAQNDRLALRKAPLEA